MAKKSLESLSDKEFEREWNKAAKALEEAKAVCREFSQENDRRVLKEQARQRAEAMTDAERQALIQEVQAIGIESEEKVSG